MDIRHHSRIRSDISSRTTHLISILTDSSTFQKPSTILRNVIRYLKKIAIPVAAVSSSFLFANIAHAESFIERGSVEKHGLFNDYGDQNLWERVSALVGKVETTIEWFSHFPEHVYHFTADIFSWIFKTLMMIGFQTPTFIFNNPYTQHTSLLFSSISVMIVILFTMFESFVQMLSKVSKKKYTNFYTIMKRFPIAIGASLSLPYIFEKGFKLLNRITRGIASLGGDLFKGDNFSNLLTLSGIDIIGMIVFDVVCIGLIIPVLINQGRRLWRIFLHVSISPILLSCWIFDRHRHHFNTWLENVKDLAFVQIVFATFILLMGLLLYTVRFLSADMWIFKILIIIGALHHLANPPSFVTRFDRTDRKSEIGLFDSYKNLYSNVRRVTSLKNVKGLRYYNAQKQLRADKLALRSKHGKRFVDDLIKK